jgi:hypothetical protein
MRGAVKRLPDPDTVRLTEVQLLGPALFDDQGTSRRR